MYLIVPYTSLSIRCFANNITFATCKTTHDVWWVICFRKPRYGALDYKKQSQQNVLKHLGVTPWVGLYAISFLRKTKKDAASIPNAVKSANTKYILVKPVLIYQKR